MPAYRDGGAVTPRLEFQPSGCTYLVAPGTDVWCLGGRYFRMATNPETGVWSLLRLIEAGPDV